MRARTSPLSKSVRLAILLGALPFALIAQTPEKRLHIYHFDVGNGDATLVATASGQALLIDGGRVGMGRKKIIPKLTKLKVSALDYIIATHFDPEHTGGLQEVWESIPMTGKGTAYDRLRAWPNFRGVPDGGAVLWKNENRTALVPGSVLKFDDPDLKVTCVAVNGKVPGGVRVAGLAENDENARSIALTIEYHDFRYFIGGDLTGGGGTTPDVESSLADVVGRVAVLRVNHHGSQTSSNQKFLAALKPKVAIISVGTSEMNEAVYHFPSAEVLQRLSNLAPKGLEKIYLTSGGDTVATSKDKGPIEVINGDIEVATTGRVNFTVNGKTFTFDEKKE